MCEKLRQFSSEDFDNVDTPIIFSRKFDEYGLKIWDGGTSSIILDFCPWCGDKLLTSKRDRWFDEIEKLGIDPWTEDVPSKYNTDEWFRDTNSKIENNGH